MLQNGSEGKPKETVSRRKQFLEKFVSS